MEKVSRAHFRVLMNVNLQKKVFSFFNTDFGVISNYLWFPIKQFKKNKMICLITKLYFKIWIIYSYI